MANDLVKQGGKLADVFTDNSYLSDGIRAYLTDLIENKSFMSLFSDERNGAEKEKIIQQVIGSMLDGECSAGESKDVRGIEGGVGLDGEFEYSVWASWDNRFALDDLKENDYVLFSPDKQKVTITNKMLIKLMGKYPPQNLSQSNSLLTGAPAQQMQLTHQ